ncbi:MAG: peptidoglycan DD-metalloendopeptidase family protein [Methylococcales bacterium]
MIKNQWLGSLGVSIRRFVAYLIGFLLVAAAATVNAKALKVHNRSHTTHTQIVKHTIKPGEGVSQFLSRLNASEANQIVSSSEDRTHFMTISTDAPREFKGLASGRDSSSGYISSLRKFNSYTHKFNMLQMASGQGTIATSLAQAGKNAGLSEQLMDQLTQIFAWDIDFATNLHNGDHFTVVYERGGFNGVDDIVAAEFINRGKIYRAVRYIDKEGFANYYTPDGKALQKAFLSTPVDFARISSHFDLNRKHPVLNRIRAHKGVDYAARTGTPVKATGAGEVAFLGRKGGYGQVIIIKHGDRYETVYAHLSRYKSGLQEGSAVRQGEVIGYVGQTGLATGPHLHYEFRMDGIHQNPLTAQVSNSMPVKSAALADFKSQVQDPLVRLNLIKAKSLFVKNNNSYN